MASEQCLFGFIVALKGAPSFPIAVLPAFPDVFCALALDLLLPAGQPGIGGVARFLAVVEQVEHLEFGGFGRGEYVDVGFQHLVAELPLVDGLAGVALDDLVVLAIVERAWWGRR